MGMTPSTLWQSHVDNSDMEVVAEFGVPGISDGVETSWGGRLIRVGAVGVILLDMLAVAVSCGGVYIVDEVRFLQFAMFQCAYL